MRAIVLGTVFLFISSLCFSQEKINGLSIVSTSKPIPQKEWDHITDVNTNWVTFIPYAYAEYGESFVRFRSNYEGYWGESHKGIRECIQKSHKEGMKVMIKPQLWFNHGSYTGDFVLESSEDWARFESDYRDYLLPFVNEAIEASAEMFCIGTELTKWVDARPQFWEDLIGDIRLMYSGKLIYAANWDAYKRMPFWSSLDYIGVDAYFPLCEHETPTVADCIAGWQSHKKGMKRMSDRYGKPIVFCEWGYRSVNQTGSEPWDYSQHGGVNLEGQQNAFEATFDCFWNEPWFYGGFVWKWYPAYDKVGGHENDRFTPQKKPAEEVIRRRFQEFSQ